MPSVEDWITSPLSVVDRCYSESPNDVAKNVYSFFENKLKNYCNQDLVPFLNGKKSHEIKSGSLVKFRCMLQDDGFSPEYFHSNMVVDSKKECFYFREPKYSDEMTEEPVHPDCERQVFYCVEAPCESQWVRKANYKVNDSVCAANKSASGIKRPHDDDDNEEMEVTVAESASGGKKLKAGDGATLANNRPVQFTKNQPIPNFDGLVCLLKVEGNYKGNYFFKLNKVYDFYGIIQMDVACYEGDDAETRSLHPPSSIVPRLHLVAGFRVVNNNPTLSKSYELMDGEELDLYKTLKAAELHSLMMEALTQATFGDKLAAFYLLLHLISKVKFQPNIEQSIGKLVINLTTKDSLAKTLDYGGFLSKYLEYLVTSLHYWPMTLSNMNEQKLIPCINPDTNRLESGMLQLPDNTHVLLDETKLGGGTLHEKGLINLDALINASNNSQVYYKMLVGARKPFTHCFNILIVSEGKSMLPFDVEIPLKCKPCDVPADLDAYLESCKQVMAPRIGQLREYLTLASQQRVELDSAPLLAAVQSDFVEVRQKRGSDAYTLEELKLRMTLIGCYANALGQQNIEILKRVADGEACRKARLSKNN